VHIVDAFLLTDFTSYIQYVVKPRKWSANKTLLYCARDITKCIKAYNQKKGTFVICVVVVG